LGFALRALEKSESLQCGPRPWLTVGKGHGRAGSPSMGKKRERSIRGARETWEVARLGLGWPELSRRRGAGAWRRCGLAPANSGSLRRGRPGRGASRGWGRAIQWVLRGGGMPEGGAPRRAPSGGVNGGRRWWSWCSGAR
jgi:hypothetical protein